MARFDNIVYIVNKNAIMNVTIYCETVYITLKESRKNDRRRRVLSRALLIEDVAHVLVK